MQSNRPLLCPYDANNMDDGVSHLLFPFVRLSVQTGESERGSGEAVRACSRPQTRCEYRQFSAYHGSADARTSCECLNGPRVTLHSDTVSRSCCSRQTQQNTDLFCILLEALILRMQTKKQNGSHQERVRWFTFWRFRLDHRSAALRPCGMAALRVVSARGGGSKELLYAVAAWHESVTSKGKRARTPGLEAA